MVYSSPVGCFRSFSGCSGFKGAVEEGEAENDIRKLRFRRNRRKNKLFCDFFYLFHTKYQRYFLSHIYTTINFAFFCKILVYVGKNNYLCRVN